MDNKTVFVRTGKGEDEMHSRTSHLAGDTKRALLMVDGSATFGEIKKRAAPSMRATLGDMFEELQKGGFIQDKELVGKGAKITAPAKMSVPGKMVTPVKAATPAKVSAPQNKQMAEDDGGELDFLTGFPVTPPEKVEVVTEHDRKLRAAEAAERSRKEVEAENLMAQREAQAIRQKSEQEAAQIKVESEHRAKQQEAVRLKAEQEATRARNELDSRKNKDDEDNKLRLEAAIKEQQQAAEALRQKSLQEAKQARDDFEAARIKAEQDALKSIEAAAKAREQAEAARLKAEQEAQRAREELEAARVKAEQDAKTRIEAAARERERAEAERLKAEQEAAKMQAELEAAKLRAEREAMAKLEAAAEAQARSKAEQARNKAEGEAAKARLVAEMLAKPQPATPAAKPDAFSFDSFELGADQNSQVPHQAPAVSKAEPVPAAPGDKKPDAFAFDSFEVGEQQTSPDEPQAVAKSSPAAQADAPTGSRAEQADEPESRPGKEAKRREAQERAAEEQRIAAEKQVQSLADAQAKELAEAQAKVWAEAEQRALEVARANAGRAAYQTEHVQPEAVAKPHVARAPRRPFAPGRLLGFVVKLGMFLLVLLVAALFIVPYVLPMRDYMPKVQQLLSDRLHQPVHIGYLSGRILPMPSLELGEIYIGDAKQFQAENARINFSLLGLFEDAKPISSIELKGVKVRGAWVRDCAAWLQQIATDKQYPVSSMMIREGTLDADAFQLNGVAGELNFNQAGKFTRANLHAEADKYSLGLDITSDNKLQASVLVHDGALPLLPNWNFAELTAKGVLTNDRLQISDYDARILGGSVQGDAVIDWHSGWRAQGTLSAKAISMQDMSKLLNGNVDGSARFKMNSVGLAGLTDTVSLEGSFTTSNGLISGMDIVETARMRSREILHGGRTHYDTLSGVINYADSAYHFKQVKIGAGVLNATASFDVIQKQLSGNMNVILSMHDNQAPVDLKLGGAIDEPTLVYVP